MIVVMLLSQFENGLAAFKIMTRDDTGIIKLVQHAIYRRQPNFFTHINQALVQIFRTDVMALRFLKHFRIFSRGSVTFRPAFFNAVLLSVMRILSCYFASHNVAEQP